MTTINYAILHCWRKVVMRLTVACMCFHFGLHRHGILYFCEMPGGSNEIAFDGWHYVEGVISDARLQAFTALWSCFPFRGEPGTSIGCGQLSWRFKVKAPPTQMEYWIKRYAHTDTYILPRIWILMKVTIPFSSTWLARKNCKLNLILL